jgi:hypothetical protein
VQLARDYDDSERVAELAAQVSANLKRRGTSTKVVNIGASQPTITEKILRLKQADPTNLVQVEINEGSGTAGPDALSPTVLTNASGAAGTGPKKKEKVVRLVRHYTSEELETMALEIAAFAICNSTEQDVVDIRKRRGAGADATVDWKTFVEIKSFFGDPPSSVSLTRHECARAREAGRDFILAIISGLGEGFETRVRLIPDPLRNASWESVGGITVKKTTRHARLSFERRRYMPQHPSVTPLGGAGGRTGRSRGGPESARSLCELVSGMCEPSRLRLGRKNGKSHSRGRD